MFSLFIIFFTIIVIITFFVEQKIYYKTMSECDPNHEWIWEAIRYILVFIRRAIYVILGSGMFVKILIYLKETKLLL